MGPQPKYPVIIYIHGESYEWNSGNPYGNLCCPNKKELIEKDEMQVVRSDVSESEVKIPEPTMIKFKI